MLKGPGPGAPSGNKNACKSKRWKHAINKALDEYENAPAGVLKGQALDQLAKNVVANAMNGDWDSIQEIAVRLDGKPAQAIVGDDEMDPISVREILIRAVDAASDRPATQGD